MAAGIPFMEEAGRKAVQMADVQIRKITTGFGLFSSLSKGKIHFYCRLTSNLSFSYSFKLHNEI